MQRNHTCGGKMCKCSTCGTEANSIPGSTHRRCGGQPATQDADGNMVPFPIRPLRDKLGREHRGTWA